MTNKIKLLLWSFLTILFVWLSSTYALDITSYRSSEVDCITEKLGKNLLWVNWWNYYSSNYFECLYKSIDPEDDYFKNYSKKSNTNFFENKKYIYMEWYTYSDFFWSYNPFYIVSAPSSNYKLWKDENGIYVFSVLEKEDKKMYKRMKLKVNGDTPVKISSKRWSNIYKKGIVLDWLQLFTKDGDQMRVASIIDNSYTLDWFSFLNVNWSFRLLDTYKNKMYKYPWLSSDEGKYISKWLFYNLYNIKPYEIYDVVWNLGTDGKFYYEYGKYLNFSLENKKVGTKEDLKIIQQDLKDSLNIIDKENVEYYLWMQPEELWISSNPDLPKNQDKWENNENNKSYEENLKEYNSCTSYRNNIKTYTTYDKECYRSLLDSAPLTWAVNHKKLLAPRNAVVNWNGEWELDIDTEDRICLQFKDRKAVYKQKRSKQWEEFQAISKENWLSPSGINVEEKCGQRLERSLWGKITHPSESFQNWRDSFNWFWWSAIVVSGDQKLYNYDYRADTEELKRLRELCFEKDFMERNFLKEEEVDQQKKHYCERYYKKKAEILKKYQNWDNFFNGKTLTWYINEIWSWDHQYVDLKRLKSFLDRISKPYESWFNSIDFVKPMCWSYKTDFFNIFIYVFFFGWVLYFIKILK